MLILKYGVAEGRRANPGCWSWNCEAFKDHPDSVSQAEACLTELESQETPWEKSWFVMIGLKQDGRPPLQAWGCDLGDEKGG